MRKLSLAIMSTAVLLAIIATLLGVLAVAGRRVAVCNPRNPLSHSVRVRMVPRRPNGKGQLTYSSPPSSLSCAKRRQASAAKSVTGKLPKVKLVDFLALGCGYRPKTIVYRVASLGRRGGFSYHFIPIRTISRGSVPCPALAIGSVITFS